MILLEKTPGELRERATELRDCIADLEKYPEDQACHMIADHLYELSLLERIEQLSKPVTDEEWGDCSSLVSKDEGRHYDRMIDRECFDSILAARVNL